jgi:hypothetical protein
MTAGELASRSQLGRTSVYPTLHELEDAGIVELVGVGSQRQVKLRPRHPLSRPIKELFRAERGRYESLMAALRSLVTHLPSRPIAVWMIEATADNATDNRLELFFVAPPEEIDKTVDTFNARLPKVEREYDIHIPVHGLTRSELEALYRAKPEALKSLALLGGVPPEGLVQSMRSPSRALASHSEHDARSRRLALAVAAKIRRDPNLVRSAEVYAQRRSEEASPGERRELMEWIRILRAMPPARLQKFLIEDTEYATRLRQTLPTLNLLSTAERAAVLRANSDEEAMEAVAR